jgi:hypothetical protein
LLHLEDPPGIGQPLVVAHLVADEEKDHQAGRHADGEAEDVDEGVGPILGEGPEAHRQIILPHRLGSYS